MTNKVVEHYQINMKRNLVDIVNINSKNRMMKIGHMFFRDFRVASPNLNGRRIDNILVKT